MPIRIAPQWWLLVSAVPIGVALPVQNSHSKADFSRDVLAVFKGRCISCHSGASAAGGLDLSQIAGIKKGGASGKLVVPGDPEKSVLIRRLLGKDGLPQMPMGFVPLNNEKIDLIRQWIRAGAKMEVSNKVHWAYRAPVRPKVPVGIKGWRANPIDSFVGERLRRAGLKPSAPASKEKQLRRVTLDLTGLPPTVDERAQFINDQSSKAYEKVVNRLLLSPHYGERQARIWLDLARYADTNGYEADRTRQAYLYRDWVIGAFNRNMPFHQFTLEQLAGDLLPNATTAQRIATGFHRNTMFNEEGGVDAEESMYETILDRVGTTSTVWLGSTMACARCHDHKYDPFTQRDFYRMYAFFGNNQYQAIGEARVGQRKFYEPTLKVPTDDQRRQMASLRTKIEAINAKLKGNEAEARFEQWLMRPAATSMWKAVVPTSVSASGGAILTSSEDGLVAASGPNPDRVSYELVFESGQVGALKISPLPDQNMAAGGAGRSDSGNFVLSTVKLSLSGLPAEFRSVAADFVQDGYDPTRIISESGGAVEGVWAVYPKVSQPHNLLLALKEPLSGKVVLRLTFDSIWKKHGFSRFRVYVASSAMALLDEPPPAIESLRNKRNLSAADRMALRSYFESAHPDYSVLRRELKLMSDKVAKLEADTPSALVLAERPTNEPLKSYVHVRGEYLNRGEMVYASTPSFLPPMPSEYPKNRLGLAKWLFSKRNPLTARVTVNRIWAQYFGRGLVETEEDFGTQGSPPSHPELLDWLACELRDSGWNLKHIHRLIVTSETYRQTSNVSPGLLAKDPANVLLARGPRFRMEAEMIRDLALTASGLLDAKIGGPSVMPYQPDGVWDSPFSGESWKPAQGGDQYRRGLYVFWKRTSPYPSFMALDASSRESCTVRRIRTNTPLQALALMNDRVYVEAAWAMAQRALRIRDERARVTNIFVRCTGRLPRRRESDRILALASELKTKYSADGASAQKLANSFGKVDGVEPNKLAAWAMVCSVVLNLDETITKD